MIKYFCDVCEGEVDKDNLLNELTIELKPLSGEEKVDPLLVIQICDGCGNSLNRDIRRALQRVIRGY